ncbi:MAG: CoA transferase [Gammaproteobacteria bacterium]|nr:CoA transferase [Gammaproteobacteria bacterium]
MAAPLTGIRVLDLTRVLAGPWCTQMLGDLGAEVIKVENPERGDDTRQWGPPWLKDENGDETKESAYFLSANRNKSSIKLNLKSPEGLEVLKQLVRESDVFIENFKVGGLAKMGLDYDTLKLLNPGLIYLSITGFGQTGPMASQPSYDYLIQGLGGLMSITGKPDDEPGGGSQRVGVAISDLTTGMYAAVGILSALHHRHASGEGQYIDLALLDTQVGWLANQATNYLIGGKIPQRTGNWHPNLAPYQPFPTSDGEVIIAVGNDRQFGFLCEFIGMSHLSTDPRYQTNPDRNRNREDLSKMIAAQIIKQPSDYWLNGLPKAGVPCSAINTIDKTFANEQVQARGMKIELPHPLSGTVAGVGNPLKFSETPVEYHKAPPLHGEDTHRILSKVLGLSEDEITHLEDVKAV